jgi:hypothetical protein
MLFVLKKTCFQFNGKFYDQISGTTMGKKCAPSYAIIFMAHLESRFLRTQVLKPLVWWRYIDDIFMIWLHSRQELNSFMACLNQFHESIKFTYDINPKEANFLDTQISKDNTGILQTINFEEPSSSSSTETVCQDEYGTFSVTNELIIKIGQSNGLLYKAELTCDPFYSNNIHDILNDKLVGTVPKLYLFLATILLFIVTKHKKVSLNNSTSVVRIIYFLSLKKSIVLLETSSQ